MPSIPHSFHFALFTYAAPLAALLVALALPLVARGQRWGDLSAPLALLAGWSLLQPVSLQPEVIWAPHRGLETLLAPALACVAGSALLIWRGGRQTRLTAVAMAVFAGWWIARHWVGTEAFWRVWFAIGVLAAALSRVMQRRADRLLVLAAALWGGLVVAGAGPGVLMAALVAVAAGVGLVAAGAPGAVPSAAIAALLGVVDLAGGRLLRGRLDPVDLVCLGSLAAPLVADWTLARLGRLPSAASAVVGRALAVGGVVGLLWLSRRAFFT